jgi:ubiquinone/menaquinone biosynthesis C-methylase UbiE
MRASLDQMVDILKAAAESSRLRILSLLSRGDLTVSDLTDILAQSQPRVSRHLKLLMEAGLVVRYQEGSWAFFRLSDEERVRNFIQAIVSRMETGEGLLGRDGERLEQVKVRRQARAKDYFDQNAAAWDRLRTLHAPDRAVEDTVLRVLGRRGFQSMLDLGTGTGRLLVLCASLYRRGTGIDMSREMLAVARANLDRAGVTHAQVRQGDIYAPPVERDSFDLVTIHQVLHYLEEPGRAIKEAARLLRAGGRLLLVDFAPHNLEFLREEHAHLRLGFSDQQIRDWFAEAEIDMEAIESIAPKADGEAGLTVKVWVGRDRRLLIADDNDESLKRETV